MYNFLKNQIKKINERKNIFTFSNIFEGLLLIISTLIILIFDKNIGDIALLYLLPISLIILGYLNLKIANKNKKIDLKRWIFLLIKSIIYSSIAIYIIISKNIDENIGLIILSLIFILNNIFDFIIYKDKNIFSYIKLILVVVLSILIIIFNSYIAENLISLLLIILLVLGLLKLIIALIIKRK